MGQIAKVEILTFVPTGVPDHYTIGATKENRVEVNGDVSSTSGGVVIDIKINHTGYSFKTKSSDGTDIQPICIYNPAINTSCAPGDTPDKNKWPIIFNHNKVSVTVPPLQNNDHYEYILFVSGPNGNVIVDPRIGCCTASYQNPILYLVLAILLGVIVAFTAHWAWRRFRPTTIPATNVDRDKTDGF